mmetsp:Transcript_31423/g.67833  ORF Transcript_31423/g.67833 Transcript_31423/m.67833 type:complete len:229 (+) Transcript_31423:69-755(+)
MSPQILMGASNSKRLGCFVKISRAAIHKLRISASVSWTGFPGRPFRASKRRFIMSSTTLSSMAIVKPCPTPQLTCPLRGRRKKERKDRSLVFFAVAGPLSRTSARARVPSSPSLSLLHKRRANGLSKCFFPTRTHSDALHLSAIVGLTPRPLSPLLAPGSIPPHRRRGQTQEASSHLRTLRTHARVHVTLPSAIRQQQQPSPPPRLYRYLPSRLAPRTGRKPSRRGHR